MRTNRPYEDTRSIYAEPHGVAALQEPVNSFDARAVVKACAIAIGRWIALVLAITVGVHAGINWIAHDISDAFTDATKPLVEQIGQATSDLNHIFKK
jgi:hypothetical protein